MNSDRRIGIIVVAAGSGTRLGADEPKAFVTVGGRNILAWALDGVFASSTNAQVVVVAPESHVVEASAIARHAAGAAAESVTVVVGGAARQDSVSAGLSALESDVQVVLVHDAARALAPGDLFDRVSRRVDEVGGGVIPVLPVTDTVKRVGADGAVEGTIDRASLGAVQTPQGFPRSVLESALAAARTEYTDDAAAVAAIGGRVVTVPGDPDAFKITTPWDLRRAEGILSPSTGVRTGVGVDVHAYDAGSPLWLGGLFWPDEPGLAGHSDGDAVLHAICDALLSAAGLGDIGSRFGAADERFRDARSEVFVRETLGLLAEAGFSVVNVAVQVVATRPRMSGRRAEAEQRLGRLVGAPVSVSATTTDGLGFIGRGDGVAAIATALIRS